jgi:hypothetical protein
LAIDQHRTFDAQLATIGRVFPGFFPHPAATWSSPRPNIAIPSRCPAGHRIPPERSARAWQTAPAQPTPENTHEPRCPSRTRAAGLSTDSRSVAHKRFRWPPAAKRVAGDLPYGSSCNAATTVPDAPRVRRESGETLTPTFSPQITSVRKKNDNPLPALR